MATSRPRHRAASASRAPRTANRRARHTPWFRACALFFASLALAAPSRASSEGTADGTSVSGAPAVDGLRPVPFETTALVGFDARNAPVTAIPTTIGGSVEWLGGFQVRFPGEVRETGQSWNDFGGWSALVGDARGERLWTLTDNYAYLLRLELELDSETNALLGVRSIENATDFAVLTPLDASRLDDVRETKTSRGEEAFGDNDGAVRVARRVDVESIVSIPSKTTLDDDANPTVVAESGDYEADGGLLADFAVGVEDSWELPANNLIRFRRGRRGAWADVPGADEALDACDANLGPEALVWVPETDTQQATLITFCETPSANSSARADAVRGFAFPDVSEETSPAPPRDGPVARFDLVNVDADCGLSDAALTPDGAHVLLLYHCYSYPPGLESRFGTGTHSTQIRVAATAALRGDAFRLDRPLDDTRDSDARPVREVEARLLARWSGVEGCPLTNMEGMHAVASADGRDVDLVLVSDNNLQPDDPTQIVRLRVVGGVDVPVPVAAALETREAREARRVTRSEAGRPENSDGDKEERLDALDARAVEAVETIDASSSGAREAAGSQSLAALGDAAPRATGTDPSPFRFGGERSGDEQVETRAARNETTSKKKPANLDAPLDARAFRESRFERLRAASDAFADVETGIAFVDDAVERDAAFIDRISSDENAYAAVERERGAILSQLRAMSLFTVAATLATSAVVAVAAMAAAAVARKARAGGTPEEMRPLGVGGGVAYPKPYGYSDEFEYDAV